ncbi:MAG: hypothetical protein ABFE07_00420 [Armatimonadia bacterium]
MRHYFTGAACANGHFSPRGTSSKKCLACHRERQARIRDTPEQKEARRAYDRRRWEKDRAYFIEKGRRYHADNRDQVNEQKREYWAENREQMAEARKRWKAKNRARVRHMNACRKKLIAIATPPWADRSAILAVYEEAERVTEATGVQHHVDHIVPIKGESVCGLHVHYNLRPLPWDQNIKKKNRLVE